MSARIYTYHQYSIGCEQKLFTYASLEISYFVVCQGVGLGNDRDKVYSSMKLAHEFHVDGLQAGEMCYEMLRTYTIGTYE